MQPSADPAAVASPPAGESPRQSLTVSTIWLLLAKVLGFAFNIGLPLLIVRRLSQVEFGHYKQVFLVVNTANTILPIGFGMTAFYFFPREPARRREILFNVVLFYGAIGLATAATLLAFPSVLVSLFGDASLLGYARPMAALIPLWLISYLIEVIPVVHQDFKLATTFIILSQFSRTALLLFAAWRYGTVGSLITAAVVHAAIQTLVLLSYMQRRQPGFLLRFHPGLFWEQLRYALPLGYAALIWGFQNDLHSYFVSHQFGAAAFAIYSVGCFQVPLLGMLNEAAASVLIGRVSELRIREDAAAQILDLTARVWRKLAVVAAPVYGFLIVMGHEFIRLLFTARYEASWPVFAINLTVVLLVPVLIDPVMRAYPEHMSYTVKMRTVLFAAMVLALWLCVGRFGPLAAIIISVLTAVLDRALIVLHLAGALGFGLRDLKAFAALARIACCAAIASAATAILRQAFIGSLPIVSLAVCGVAYVAVYGLALILFRVPAPEERAQVLGYLDKVRARF